MAMYNSEQRRPSQATAGNLVWRKQVGEITKDLVANTFARPALSGQSQSLQEAGHLKPQENSKFKFKYEADCPYRHSKIHTDIPRITLIYRERW